MRSYANVKSTKQKQLNIMLVVGSQRVVAMNCIVIKATHTGGKSEQQALLTDVGASGCDVACLLVVAVFVILLLCLVSITLLHKFKQIASIYSQMIYSGSQYQTTHTRSNCKMSDIVCDIPATAGYSQHNVMPVCSQLQPAQHNYSQHSQCHANCWLHMQCYAGCLQLFLLGDITNL